MLLLSLMSEEMDRISPVLADGAGGELNTRLVACCCSCCAPPPPLDLCKGEVVMEAAFLLLASSIRPFPPSAEGSCGKIPAAAASCGLWWRIVAATSCGDKPVLTTMCCTASRVAAWASSHVGSVTWRFKAGTPRAKVASSCAFSLWMNLQRAPYLHEPVLSKDLHGDVLYSG